MINVSNSVTLGVDFSFWDLRTVQFASEGYSGQSELRVICLTAVCPFILFIRGIPSIGYQP